jgi:hypothetical protein
MLIAKPLIKEPSQSLIKPHVPASPGFHLLQSFIFSFIHSIEDTSNQLFVNVYSYQPNCRLHC